jgi:putative FmdB family regulatory protein
MPIFEYACKDCGRQFETFVTANRTPACPACQGVNLAKLLSTLGMVGTASSREPSCAMPASPMCGARGGRCGCA